MEKITKDPILEFHPDTLEAVRRMYDLDKPGDMDKAIDILEEWIKKQNHFTKKDFSRDFLERKIISNKGSVERTKSRLDKLFTIKSLMPMIYQNFDPRTDFEDIKDNLNLMVLPKLTKEHDRIFLFKVVGNKFSSQNYLNLYRFTMLMIEYIAAHDYAGAYRVIVDDRDASMPEVLSALDINELRQGVTIFLEGYGFRLKGIHLIIDSKFVALLIAIGKQVLSEKLSKRIHCHKNVEQLWEYIPREILPKDLGGDERPTKEIHADCRKVLCTEEYRNHLKDMIEARSDETLRSIYKFNDQYIGLPGTFRSLTVD